MSYIKPTIVFSNGTLCPSLPPTTCYGIFIALFDHIFYYGFMLEKEEWNKLKNELAVRMKTKIRDKYIKAIHVNSANHWQPPLYIEVNQYCQNLEKDSPKEKIVAIFDATVFLVVTEERGLNQTMPYFFARTDVTQVIEETLPK